MYSCTVHRVCTKGLFHAVYKRKRTTILKYSQKSVGVEHSKFLFLHWLGFQVFLYNWIEKLNFFPFKHLVWLIYVFFFWLIYVFSKTSTAQCLQTNVKAVVSVWLVQRVHDIDRTLSLGVTLRQNLKPVMWSLYSNVAPVDPGYLNWAPLPIPGM